MGSMVNTGRDSAWKWRLWQGGHTGMGPGWMCLPIAPRASCHLFICRICMELPESGLMALDGWGKAMPVASAKARDQAAKAAHRFLKVRKGVIVWVPFNFAPAPAESRSRTGRSATTPVSAFWRHFVTDFLSFSTPPLLGKAQSAALCPRIFWSEMLQDEHNRHQESRC